MNDFFRKLVCLLYPLFVFSTSCSNSVKEPEFIRASHFKIDKLGMKQTTLSMKLVYYNPNAFKLGFERADLDVFLDSRFMGKTTLDSLIQIPAKDTFNIPVKISLEMKNLASNLFTLATKEEVEVSLRGKARIRKAGIGIDLPVNYTGKQRFFD